MLNGCAARLFVDEVAVARLVRLNGMTALELLRESEIVANCPPKSEKFRSCAETGRRFARARENTTESGSGSA